MHGFLLYLCVYSAWPDITLCARLVIGFSILGHIECPPIFRLLLRPSQTVGREVLLEDADDFVRRVQRKLTKHRITEADWKLWEATKKDLNSSSWSIWWTRRTSTASTARADGDIAALRHRPGGQMASHR